MFFVFVIICTSFLFFNVSGNFTDDAFKTTLRPALIHIYHNFGMKGWDIWDYVEDIGNKLPAS